jgi:hypothetical protein
LGIDKKTDDAKPGTGNVRTFPQGADFSGDCATSAVTNSAEYNLGSKDPECILLFKYGM